MPYPLDSLNKQIAHRHNQVAAVGCKRSGSIQEHGTQAFVRVVHGHE